MIYNRNMPHEAVYWAPGVNDGSGIDFSAVVPVVITCRWQDDVSTQRDAEGEEFIASHIVYCDQAIEAQGFLARLTGVAPVGPTDPTDYGAKEIRQVYRTDDLSGLVTLYKAVL